MADTTITLTNDQGVLVPSQPSVPVKSGDTVSFATNDGSTAYLFFSPAAAAALLPAPASPVAVTSTPATFTFAVSVPGAYSVFFEASAGAAVPEFPVAASNLLMLEVDPSGVSFSAVNTNTKG